MKVTTFFLALFLAGCFSVVTGTDESEQKGTPIIESTQTSQNIQTGQEQQLFAGKYVYGHEVSSFQACNNSSESFWLGGNQGDMAIINEASLSLAAQRGEPYQEIYVEFMGVFDSADPDGFAADYDGVLILQSLLDYSTELPPDC